MDNRNLRTRSHRLMGWMLSAIASTMASRLLWAAPNEAVPATRPNVVILYADDMGWGDLAIQNPSSQIPTPHLDQLAREGTRFTDGHSSSGICSPSRYALLTGRYHWRKFHHIVDSFGPSVLDAEQWTLPEMLREHGYHTACFGKWHLGWDWQALRRTETPDRPKRDGFAPEDFDWSRAIPDGPLAHGFDHYFGDDVPNFPPYTWIEDDYVVTAPTEMFVPSPVPREGTAEGRPGPMAAGWQLDQVMPTLTQRVVAWLAQQQGTSQPFFLYFPWTSPHAPIVPAPEFWGSTNAGPYGDFVHQSDWTAGQVLQALDRYGFRDNTIVIFTSDNGPEHYAYDRVRRYGHHSMGPLRGVKRDIWEGGHRVPFVVRWPGVIPAGRVTNQLVSQIDLMATLAAALKIELPHMSAEDSLNLLPLWQGGTVSPRQSHVHNTLPQHYAFRQGPWVLIDAPTGAVSAMPAWFQSWREYGENRHPAGLYHLSDDLPQRFNRFETQPEVVEQLRTGLRQTRERHSASHATSQHP